jgi:hypothetical protein
MAPKSADEEPTGRFRAPLLWTLRSGRGDGPGRGDGERHQDREEIAPHGDVFGRRDEVLDPCNGSGRSLGEPGRARLTYGVVVVVLVEPSPSEPEPEALAGWPVTRFASSAGGAES